MSHRHGLELRKHISRLQSVRIAQAPDGVPDEVKHWREKREEFTGRPFYENARTGQKRWAPPVLLPGTEATLLTIREDCFLQRLRAVHDMRPKAIIVAQVSWRPDVEMISLAEPMFCHETLDVPIVQVTFEAGEELKSVLSNGSSPWVTFEIQPFGGVCAWGNSTSGQLGLAGIENREFLQRSQNTLTQEEFSFTTEPCYVAHLHEHQVVDIACGAQHAAAVTQHGEVFAWGAASGLGVQVEKPFSDIPQYVEQLEGLVKASKVFAGHDHSFIVAEMPFRSCV